MSEEPTTTYFRRGLGFRAEVRPVLESRYGSELVDAIKASDFELRADRFTFRMARSLGFCYGVDRAVEYAYETCQRFPDRRVHLVGEIIHNPHVNRQLEEMGIEVLYPDPGGQFDFSVVRPDDVVIIPAFGVALADFETLRKIGCVVVDTTCGSVLNVWKRVQTYARDGFSAIVHGKYYHEETRATSSQVNLHPGGRYLVVRDAEETELVCAFIRGEVDDETIAERFRDRSSADFEPNRDLQKIGVANQTTMLASESLAIAAQLREAIVDRYGEDAIADRFRSFDTICSATQDRQDAVKDLLVDSPDLMLVVGGYNSSNTNNLAHLCSLDVPTYHIETSDCIDVETGEISHKEIGGETVSRDLNWLPEGPLVIGLTAGASTPDSLIGRTVEKILLMEGLDPERVLETVTPAPTAPEAD
jgi:4-hydroxy-3-methylbut-2-enyl diphosphate reductase